MNEAFESDLQPALNVLRAGGIILYPTDTVWGLGCDATNAAAVQKIFDLKQRAEGKSMIVLVGGERDILQYIAAPDSAAFLFLEAQTTPTTVIFDGALHLAPNLIAPDGSVAIRIIAESFCRHLVKRLGRPIVSTSANRSGNPTPHLFKDIEPRIIAGVDYAVHYRRSDTSTTPPSQIIKWNRDGSHTVIRANR